MRVLLVSTLALLLVNSSFVTSGLAAGAASGTSSAGPGASAQAGFPDVPPGHEYAAAIAALAARGIIRGYADGRFGPDDATVRADVAAMIARTMGWEGEDWGNRFTDRGEVDADLWRNVGTLAHYGIVKGDGGGAFGPSNPVLQVQAISVISRAMVAAGQWSPRNDDPARYPNVPGASGHRADLITYETYAGAIPGATPTTLWPTWEQPATRGWFAEVLARVLASRPPGSPQPPGSPAPPPGTACGDVPAYAEIRPGNTLYNRTAGRPTDPGQFVGPESWRPYYAGINGDCTGTTEQILEWAARKWGFDADLAKAMAVAESTWHQWAVGPHGEYGILQVNPRAWPDWEPAQWSTAYAADYAMAVVRSHYDGNSWLGGQTQGRLRDAVAAWECGCAYNGGGEYANVVFWYYETKPWRYPGEPPDWF